MNNRTQEQAFQTESTEKTARLKELIVSERRHTSPIVGHGEGVIQVGFPQRKANRVMDLKRHCSTNGCLTKLLHSKPMNVRMAYLQHSIVFHSNMIIRSHWSS